MVAGMDGCVSKPAESKALLNTLRTAIPLHLSPASSIDGRPLVVAYPRNDAGAGGGRVLRKGKGLGVLKGSTACTAAGMVLPAQRVDESVEGALQVRMHYWLTRQRPSDRRSQIPMHHSFFNIITEHIASSTRISTVVLCLISLGERELEAVPNVELLRKISGMTASAFAFLNFTRLMRILQSRTACWGHHHLRPQKVARPSDFSTS